jgi:hypothetical protein
MAPDEQATADVVVTNPTDRSLTIMEVRSATTPGLSIAGLPATPITVPASTAVPIPFTVTSARRFEEGSAELLIRVRLPRVPMSSNGEPFNDERILTPTFTVKVSASVPALTLAVSSSPSALVDGESSELVLTVDNTSPFTLAPISLLGLPGRDVTIGPPDTTPLTGGCEATAIACIPSLAPSDIAVVHLKVKANDHVHTGKQNVGVLARGTVMTGGAPSSSGVRASSFVMTATVSTPVDLTIFGMDALSPLGVATLFLVPGFVAVAMFVLGRRLYPTRGAAAQADLKDTGLLVISVALGGIVYFGIWVFKGVDLARDGAGTRQVALLFGLGVLAGAIAYGVYAIVYFLRTGRKQFTVSDDEGKVLTRLAARKAGLKLLPVNGGYFLGHNADGRAAVCPEMTFRFTTDDTQWRASFFKAAKANDLGTIKKLVKTTEKVELKWSTTRAVILTDEPLTATGPPEELISESAEAQVVLGPPPTPS